MAQVAQQRPLDQIKLAHEKLRSKAFEAAALNVSDTFADQFSLTANARWLFDASLLESTEDFSMCVLDFFPVDGQ